MKKSLIILSSFLVIALFLISSCTTEDPIGAKRGGEVQPIDGGSGGSPSGDTTKPSVSLLEPLPFKEFIPNQQIQFTCRAVDNIGLNRIELWITGPGYSSFQKVDSRFVTGTSGNAVFTKQFTNLGGYGWNCRAYDTSNNYAYAPETLSFKITTTPSETCMDTDNGKIYTVLGTTTGISTWNGELVSIVDYCSFSPLTPDEQFVNEFYCNAEDKVAQDVILCSGGCKDGACILEGGVQLGPDAIVKNIPNVDLTTQSGYVGLTNANTINMISNSNEGIELTISNSSGTVRKVYTTIVWITNKPTDSNYDLIFYEDPANSHKITFGFEVRTNKNS